MIRVRLPRHLLELAGIAGEVLIEPRATAAMSTKDLLDEVEVCYPMLRGTIRLPGRPLPRAERCTASRRCALRQGTFHRSRCDVGRLSRSLPPPAPDCAIEDESSFDRPRLRCYSAKLVVTAPDEFRYA